MNTQLNQEQIDAVVEWMMYFNIGSPTYHQFRKDFAPNDATKEAEHQKNVEHRKEILKEIIGHFNSPFMGILKMDIDDEDESEIKIGDRVRLKGDSNSPIMTVTGIPISNPIIGKGVQQNTIGDTLRCSWFPENEEDSEAKSNRPMQTVEIHKDALEKLIPTQPSNKQKPTIESDIKAGDVVEMDDTKERFYVEELQTHGVKLVKVACYQLAAGNAYLTNYENMPFKKVTLNN